MKHFIHTKEEFARFACQVLEAHWPFEPVRLIGLKLNHLEFLERIREEKTLTHFFTLKTEQEY